MKFKYQFRIPDKHNKSKLQCIGIKKDGSAWHSQAGIDCPTVNFAFQRMNLKHNKHGYYEYYLQALSLIEANKNNPQFNDSPIASNKTHKRNKTGFNCFIEDNIKSEKDFLKVLKENKTRFKTYEDFLEGKKQNRRNYQNTRNENKRFFKRNRRFFIDWEHFKKWNFQRHDEFIAPSKTVLDFPYFGEWKKYSS